MVKDDGKVNEEVDLGPTHALYAIPEPQRSQWCREVVLAVADGAEKVAKIKGKIRLAKASQAFLKDLRSKKDELLPVLYYIIKPQFRDTVQELMERFSGYVPKEE